MKKFIFTMAAIFAVALTSCSSCENKAVEESATEDALTDTVVSTVDSVDVVAVTVENDSVCE